MKVGTLNNQRLLGTKHLEMFKEMAKIHKEQNAQTLQQITAN